MVFVTELSRNHLGKVKSIDYAISNTGIQSLSVETPENIKMPNIITKAIEVEDYRHCALSKGHLYHNRLVVKSKDSLLF